MYVRSQSMNLMFQSCGVWLIDMSFNAVYRDAQKCVRITWNRKLFEEIVQNKFMGWVDKINEVKWNRRQSCFDGLPFFLADDSGFLF